MDDAQFVLCTNSQIVARWWEIATRFSRNLCTI